MVAKYGDHLLLCRQNAIHAREGGGLERSTLADWVGQCNAMLRPLVEALRKHVLSVAKRHAENMLLAAEAPKRIGMLYAVEKSICGNAPELRHAGAGAGPALVTPRAWLDAALKQFSQKRALAEAIRYAFARWAALVLQH